MERRQIMKINRSFNALVAASASFLVAAAAAPTVRAADADMQRQESVGEVLDDTVVTSKVKAAFVQDEQVGALRINVTTYKGIVQLSGFANSAQEADHAAAVARTVPGVRQVKNDILLKQQLR
jgi:osmotically-inducible protein OsmY